MFDVVSIYHKLPQTTEGTQYALNMEGNTSEDSHVNKQ